jgi:hypothetical protein
MDGWIQCLGHIAAGSKPIPFFSFPSDLIALGAFLRLSLSVDVHPLDSLFFFYPLYIERKRRWKAILTLFLNVLDDLWTVTRQ